MSDLITVDELAEILKVPKSWVYGKTRETGLGFIPRVRVGKYLRFEWDAVQRWLDKKQSEGGRGQY